MTVRTLWAPVFGMLIGALVIGLLFVPVTYAQELVDAGAARTTGEAALQQIDLALEATDIGVARGNLQGAVASLQEQQAVLQNALAAATTDAQRSRAQGLLDHVNAALASANIALEASDLSALQSLANAARGEVFEALSEIPTAEAQPAPVEQPAVTEQPEVLPKAGGFPVEVLSLAGFASLVAGAGLRRLRR